jgi:hypothetical protein
LLHIGVVPEQDHESKQGEVVVRSLEVSEQTQHYNCHEQFVNVLDHSI